MSAKGKIIKSAILSAKAEIAAGGVAHLSLFVTTSGFTSQALETAERLGKRIVLIDGQNLTRLMIRFNVGCRIEQVMELKKVDEDFFDIS